MKYKYATPALKRRARPETWIHGPDPMTHEKYYAYLKHRAQAKFRKEEYELTDSQWLEIWQDDTKFLNRGRRPDCWVLTRIDNEKAWSVDNCEIITRYDQLLRNMEEKMRIRHRNSKKRKNLGLIPN